MKRLERLVAWLRAVSAGGHCVDHQGELTQRHEVSHIASALQAAFIEHPASLTMGAEVYPVGSNAMVDQGFE